MKGRKTDSFCSARGPRPGTDPQADYALGVNRRQFFGLASTGIGVAALSSLLDPGPSWAARGVVSRAEGSRAPGALQGTHFPARAKRVIYLFQSGAPSQIDLFDHKPRLAEWHGEELPASVRGDQRVTGMTATAARTDSASAMAPASSESPANPVPPMANMNPAIMPAAAGR